MLPAAPSRLESIPPEGALARADAIAGALAHTSPGTLGAAVEMLDLPHDLDALTPAASEAAIRAYAFIAARLIHSGTLKEGRVLTQSIAQPLLLLSEAAGRPAGLTYATYVLGNWLEPLSPRCKPESIFVPRTFSGTIDEAWFIAVHLSIESIGGEIVDAISDCQVSLDASRSRQLIDAVNRMSSAIRWATAILGQIDEHIDPTTFRNRIRPNLHGFANVTFATSPPTSISYVGETGAQSGVINAIDLALAVQHDDAMEKALKRFRECAPPAHRDFMIRAQTVGSLLAAEAQSDPLIRRAYLRSLACLHAFRDRHVTIVEHYLHSGTPGTGGTTGHAWLRRLRDNVSTTASTYL
jgi:indoleamine 2,3-dioxygenase